MLPTPARLLLTGFAALSITACSSIIEGTSQEIMVNTTPEGASCVLMREGVSIARISPTPGATTVKKTKHDMTVECEKEGYQKASFFNKSDVAGATVGNIILGGGIGWAIDSASGADNKYTSPVNMTLIPVAATLPAPEAAPTVEGTPAVPPAAPQLSAVPTS